MWYNTFEGGYCMKKQRIIIAFAILLAIMLLVVGCGGGGQKEESKPEETGNEIKSEKEEGASQTEPVNAEKAPEWKEVIRFEGESIKDTETFKVSSNEWRINWSTKPGDMGEMNFQIYVYNADGDLESVAANIIGEGSDMSYIRGSGDYYLTINTAQPYTVIVEEKN